MCEGTVEVARDERSVALHSLVEVGNSLLVEALFLKIIGIAGVFHLVFGQVLQILLVGKKP